MINPYAPASNKIDCAMQCSADPQCKFWDYGAGDPNGEKFCRLRSDTGYGAIHSPGYTYGAKNCTFEGNDQMNGFRYKIVMYLIFI